MWMAAPSCRRKALRSNTCRGTPSRVWPQFWAVSDSMGSPDSVSKARNTPRGARAVLDRSMVMRRPSWTSSMRPSMAVPDQGA